MTTAEKLSTEYNDLTDRQRGFVERAKRHAEDFATRAAEHDRERSYPFENIQKLHESGYMRMCLPAQFNGEDATLLDLCLAQEALAAGCGATALAANMHSFFAGSATEAFRAGQPGIEIALAMVSQGATLGGALSEAESADPFNHPACRVDHAEGGMVKLNGRKVFGSNTPANPTVAFLGALDDGGDKTVYLFQFPRETPGVTIVDDWDTMGMRATGSFSVEFKDVMVPEAMAVASWPWGGAVADNPFLLTFLCWFAPTIAAVYTGIAVGARDIVRASAATRSRQPFGEVRHYPAVQYAIAEMYVEIEAARAMTRRTAARLSDPSWRTAEAVALGEATQQFATGRGRACR